MTSGEAGPSPSALQRLSQQEFPHSPVLGGGRGRWRKMQVLPPRRQRPSGERGRQAREETSCHWSGHIRGRPSGDTWAWSLDGEEAFCTRGGLPGGAVAGAKALRLEEPSSRGGRRGTEGPSRGREANSGQATEDLAAVEGMWPFSWERRGDPEDDRTGAAFEETVEEEKDRIRSPFQIASSAETQRLQVWLVLTLALDECPTPKVSTAPPPRPPLRPASPEVLAGISWTQSQGVGLDG